MRKFNTSGPNIPDEHYTLPRLDWIEKGKALVHDKRYFTIWAPRQTGKSTYANLLASELKNEGHHVVYVSFKGFYNQTIENFLTHLSNSISSQWGISVKAKSIIGLFQEIKSIKTEKTVMIIDNIDEINLAYLWSFLTTIRSEFHNRNDKVIKSVIFLGVRNIIRDNPSDYIPFNIGEDFDLPYFSDNETIELLNQYERETKQFFAPSVKAKISKITANQPNLVNGIAGQLVDNFPNKPIIEYADYLAIENSYIKLYLDENISSSIQKDKNYKIFIERLLFSEQKIDFSIRREVIKELYFNGIITYDEDGFVTFRVPLYRKCLYKAFYPYTNGEAKRIGSTINIDEYYTPSGRVNLNKVIVDYKEYALRRKFRYFKEKDKNGDYINLKEATLVYSFETYLNAFLNMIGGKTYLEAQTGVGRTDLIITIDNEEFVVEAKVYSDIVKFRKGKIQLAQYAKSLSLKEAIYLVFVESGVKNVTVIEEEKVYEGILIKTHLVPYNLELDF